MVVPLIVVGILLVVGVVFFIIYQLEKQRREAFAIIAAELGLQFNPKGDPAVQDALSHLHLFNQGRSRKMKNMLSGQTQNIDLAIFGYRYTTGGGDDSKTHHQSVISFQSPHLALPEFEIRPEGMFHKIGQAFGYKDIDFESHPTFSDRYLLRGPDEDAIRAFFTPERLTFFESLERISVEGGHDRLIYYRARKRIKPEDVQAFMEEGFRVFGLFKQE